MKKIISTLLIIFLFINLSQLNSYCDDIENDEDLDIQSIEVSNNSENIPEINSRHAIVIDRYSGNTIYGKKENEICKMASTTKIMTCIVVLENTNKLNDIVKISENSAKTRGSRLGLAINDEITVKNLLYGLMLCSGNDAAVALAEYISGSIEDFANLMNKKAEQLDLKSTHYITPHGLDNDNHYTTAYDLAKLTNYALNNSKFAEIVNTKTYTVIINGKPKNIHNTNELLGSYSGIYGVKTGFTSGANRCIVTACKRDQIDVICVVLGADTKKFRTSDSMKLLNYVFKNFTVVDTNEIINKEFEKFKKSHYESFNINKGKSDFLDLYLDNSDLQYKKIIINKSDVNKIECNISCNYNLVAPVYQYTKIGELDFNINNKNYLRIDIKNRNLVEKKGILDYIKNLKIKFLNF